jgi:hypothetical protein
MNNLKRVNKYGKPPARTIVPQAIARGLTTKEAAYEYGYSLRAIQEAANRMKMSFVWIGTGRPPKHLPKGNEHQ